MNGEMWNCKAYFGEICALYDLKLKIGELTRCRNFWYLGIEQCNNEAMSRIYISLNGWDIRAIFDELNQ